MEMRLKICTKCGEQKPATADHFHRCTGGLYGLVAVCKSCRLIIRRSGNWACETPAALKRQRDAWRTANLDKSRAGGRALYRKHMAKRRAQSLAWYHANKDKARAYRNALYERRPDFRIRMCLTAAIRKSLKGGKGRRSWEKLVGYDLDQLMKHLERQFSGKMAWANYGDWHVDHILPLRLFSYSTAADPDFRAAWALTNLRPIWALENLQKGGARTLLI